MDTINDEEQRLARLSYRGKFSEIGCIKKSNQALARLESQINELYRNHI